MGLNFKRTLNIGRGFRINLSKGGVGFSAGIPGLRFGVGPRGKRFQISIPGTGISYRKDTGWKNQSSSTQTLQFARIARIAVGIIALACLVFWVFSLPA
jgi:hypothetical protein